MHQPQGVATLRPRCCRAHPQSNTSSSPQPSCAHCTRPVTLGIPAGTRASALRPRWPQLGHETVQVPVVPITRKCQRARKCKFKPISTGLAAIPSSTDAGRVSIHPRHARGAREGKEKARREEVSTLTCTGLRVARSTYSHLVCVCVRVYVCVCVTPRYPGTARNAASKRYSYVVSAKRARPPAAARAPRRGGLALAALPL